jgi:flagellum-specific peptidoglycan hydrolase FlgJ
LVTERESTFLKMAVPAAQLSQSETGVPASVTIAQAILESGWGRSELALKANNYFGIKTGYLNLQPYVEFPTHEWIDGHDVTQLARFVRFESPADSFRYHAMLLAASSRYAKAMQHCDNATFFIVSLQDAGYSTSHDEHGCPDYARKLAQLIQQFDLTQYDVGPQSGPAKEVAA